MRYLGDDGGSILRWKDKGCIITKDQHLEKYAGIKILDEMWMQSKDMI